MNMFNLLPIPTSVAMADCGGECKGCQGCDGCDNTSKVTSHVPLPVV